MPTVILKITQLSSRVIRVLGCNPGPFTLQGTNTYIIGTGKKRALIDCGDPNVPEYIDSLKAVVRDHDISLSKIIITHWHKDHIGGTRDVLEKVADADCKVFKYQNSQHDQPYLDQFKLTYLQNEDEIKVEGATIKLHWTPGHSQDHLAIFLQEEEALFSGDCVLGEGSAVFENLHTYLQSLNKIISLNPKKLYPGHGPVVENPLEKVKDYIDHRMVREKQIIEALEQNAGYMAPIDIVTAVYPKLSSALLFGAENNVCHHLEKLIKDDRVETEQKNGLDKDDIMCKYRFKRSTN